MMRFTVQSSDHTRARVRPTQQSIVSVSSFKMCLWLFVALVLPQLTAGNANRVTYLTGSTASFTGREDCTIDKKWCGEAWRAGRILHYNLTEEDKLVLKNNTRVETAHNCKDTQSSLDCEQVSSVETSEQTKTRVVILTKSEEPVELRASDSPELDHSYLLSDNMVLGDGGPQQVSDHYPKNQIKIWQLKIPKGCKMTVNFLNFSIEKSDHCKNDYFSMQTSKNSSDIFVFCDQLEYIEVRYRRRVQFTFYSDNARSVGQLAAKVCMSKTQSPSGVCDCPASTRRRRAAPTMTQENDEVLERRGEAQQTLREQRLDALQRLRNRREGLNSSS